jgi:hypothetical protein
VCFARTTCGSTLSLVVEREFDPRTGRPLEGDREAVETLSDEELSVELLIAAVAVGKMRIERLGALQGELRRRRFHGRYPAGAFPS